MNSAQNIQIKLKSDLRFASVDLFSVNTLKTPGRNSGIGDLDDLKFWLKKLKIAGVSFVQFTPIHDSDLEPSPYHSQGLFSLNPISLSVEMLPKRIIDKYILPGSQTNTFNYKQFYKAKRKLLLEWFKIDNWHKKQEFQGYIQHIEFEQLNFAVFKALFQEFATPWWQWSNKYKHLSSKQILNISTKNLAVQAEIFIQWQITMQWQTVSQWAKRQGIYFILDKPIYPLPNSADVWANPDIFYLHKDGSPRYISGVNSPNDPFEQQIWNQAVYKFKEKPEQTIEFFDKNIQFLNKLSPVVRLDHILALIWQYYVIDPKTGKGKHFSAIGERILTNTQSDVFLIAEDLGYNPPIIKSVLSRLQIPRMYCPQFNRLRFRQFDKYPSNTLAFSSNHDLPSLSLWWQNLSKENKVYWQKQLQNTQCKSENECQKIIHQIFSSPAKIASISIFDLLGQKSQFNIPGQKSAQNWQQRIKIDLNKSHLDWLKNLIKTTNRSNLL